MTETPPVRHSHTSLANWRSRMRRWMPLCESSSAGACMLAIAWRVGTMLSCYSYRDNRPACRTVNKYRYDAGRRRGRCRLN